MKRASADGINISGEKVYAILGEILLDKENFYGRGCHERKWVIQRQLGQ